MEIQLFLGFSEIYHEQSSSIIFQANRLYEYFKFNLPASKKEQAKQNIIQGILSAY